VGAGRKAAFVVCAGLVLIGGSGGPVPLTAQAAGAPSWMHVDAPHKRVTFQVTAAGTGANGTLNFNGYADGQMTVTVPAGWRVHIDFVNSGAGALPHSLEVIRDVRPVPPEGVAPAIAEAESRNLIPGIPPLQADIFEFTAAPAGRYLWLCGVPRHGIQGMWDRVVVSPTARLPSVVVK